MRTAIIALLVLALIACTPAGPTCSEPYIQNGNTCCLDRDANGVCDVDENASLRATQEAQLDCSLCPPRFVTEKEEVTVYKYVCTNQTVVDDPAECAEPEYVSNAHEFTVSRQQDETLVHEFDARPACRGQFRAAELHIVPERAPVEMIVEVMRTPNTVFETLLVLDGTKEILDDKYVYVGLCDDVDCEGIADVTLVPSQAYLVRAVWQQDGKRVVTRDQLIDPTPEGKFGQQRC